MPSAAARATCAGRYVSKVSQPGEHCHTSYLLTYLLTCGQAAPAEWPRNPSETRPVAADAKPTAEQEEKLRRHLAALGTAGTAAQLKVAGAEAGVAAAAIECRDSNSRCPDWAKAGECARNQGFMRANCPLSCDLCGESRFQKLATMA